MKKNNKKKMIEAFNAMELAGDLPLFDNEAEELELCGPISQINPEDMEMVRIVNVAVSLNNCISTIDFARNSIQAAFSGEGALKTELTGGLVKALKELQAVQVAAMKTVAKRVKLYAKAQTKRKPTPQTYEKTYTKIKVVA